jgi:uncharacterized protein (DUF433 family)
MDLTTVQHIVQTPGLCGGKPHIVDTRITSSDVAFFHLKMGLSVAKMAAAYDLSLASVHAALAYYFDHRAEIDLRMVEDEAYAAALEKQNPSQFQDQLVTFRQNQTN